MGGINNFKRIEDEKYELDVEKETQRIILTGKLYSLMDKHNISKAKLSMKMKKSRPAITHLLSGDRNFTIDKLTELAYHIGYKMNVSFTPLHNIQKNYIEIFYSRKIEENMDADISIRIVRKKPYKKDSKKIEKMENEFLNAFRKQMRNKDDIIDGKYLVTN